MRRLSYANVMSTIAVFVALGGASYAIVSIPNDSVGTKQVKNHSLGVVDLSRRAVKSLRGKTGARGATGATGPAGTNGTNGAKGDKGDTGPAGTGWATSVIAQQVNVQTGFSFPPADSGDDPTVTVTVPSSGLVQVYARAHIQTDANGDARLALFVDGAEATEGCGVGGLLVLTVSNQNADFATAPSFCGVKINTSGGPIAMGGPTIVAVPPGTHTFKLVYGIDHTGGGNTTIAFSDRRLAVAPVS